MPPGGEGSSKKKRLTKDSKNDKDDDSGTWECSLCTFRNRFEAFKCEMCDTRKGTSTRKPRLNENVVERQKTVQKFVVQQQEKAANSFRKRAHRSGSPTSRNSPASTSSGPSVGKAQKLANNNRKRRPNKRIMVPIPDTYIYRSSPRKVTVTVAGVSATIAEFRKKPGNADKVAFKKGARAIGNSTEIKKDGVS